MTLSDTPAGGRRAFMACFSSLGLSATLLPGVLWARMQEQGTGSITSKDITEAARIAGLDLTDEESRELVAGVNANLARYEKFRGIRPDNSVVPPLVFNPRVPGVPIDTEDRGFHPSPPPAVSRPRDLEEAAFWPVTHLGALIRSGQVKSRELTDMYLSRLKKYNPLLNCVVTITEDRAVKQAERADTEMSAGRYRGPLHGIPWGVKDIIAVEGYPTTWGAEAFRDQVIGRNATVVERLDRAGAVLIAKLTTGELAFGDRWFGGRTNNPWNPAEGSSGSSAGSGAATAAGLVGFSIGTDTGGSLLSPSERCGIVGLRPTFGRISRHGVMTAGFSLDKIGPMCRSVEDCALVLNAVAGPDGRDLSAAEGIPFNWDAGFNVRDLRIGVAQSQFEAVSDPDRRKNNEASLRILASLGSDLRPVAPPESDLNFFIEYTERAAGFQDFIRERRDGGMVWKGHRRVLLNAHLVPAVEYLQANRIRMLLMEEMAGLMADVDVIVAPAPSLDPKKSLNPVTSLTGHPVAALPNGFSAAGTPTGITISGRIYREDAVLALAKYLESALGVAGKHPDLAK